MTAMVSSLKLRIGAANLGIDRYRLAVAACCSGLPFLKSFSLVNRMCSLATAEVCDAHAALLASGDIRVLPPIFRIYGQCRSFSGPIVTLKVFEDNVLVRELLEGRGEGRVLIIDGGGSMRCALVGGNIGQLAQNTGWAGILVNGCIRDIDEINGYDIGVRALASHPQKSNKKGVGEKHIPINIAGTLIRDGEWLYADSDWYSHFKNRAFGVTVFGHVFG